MGYSRAKYSRSSSGMRPTCGLSHDWATEALRATTSLRCVVPRDRRRRLLRSLPTSTTQSSGQYSLQSVRIFYVYRSVKMCILPACRSRIIFRSRMCEQWMQYQIHTYPFSLSTLTILSGEDFRVVKNYGILGRKREKER